MGTDRQYPGGESVIFNYEAHSAQLELRIMSLEESVTGLVDVLKTMNDMIGNLNEISSLYAEFLGGLVGGSAGTMSSCCAGEDDRGAVVPPAVSLIPVCQDQQLYRLPVEDL